MIKKITTPTVGTAVCLVCLLLMSMAAGQPPSPPQVQGDDNEAGKRMTLTINGIEYAFRRCPAGTFIRGERDTQHQVTLSRGFWMLETEVTQAMWESVMGDNPSLFKGEKLPVENVHWNNCQAYITKLNALLADIPGAPTGYKFSLPTEAQWEYACRSGTTTTFHFGDTLTQEQANFSSRETKEVGSYPANAWGLLDMHGNVWEWCLDWLDSYPSDAVTDPMGPEKGVVRAFRGGGWNGRAEHCRSAYRHFAEPTGRANSVGLRLALVSGISE